MNNAPVFTMLAVLLFSGASSAAPKITSLQQLKFSGIQRQTLDYSCGAASLTILLNQYFSDSIGEQQILSEIIHRLSKEELLDRVRKGFSMLDLKNAAENLGYNAAGVMLPLEAASRLKGPTIILLRRKELNHFVVLKGVSQGKAFLADPARGNLRMPLYELQKQWHGETLIVGRDDVGLIQDHLLALPNTRSLYPESNTVRTLQQLPFK
ncbi:MULTISPECIES: C39 family peptidase [Pseudomonas]|uniref:Putative double-glycine peptidase n=1 Tax=Pseudomonas asplenii TaxID=53407 RepID=A0A0N1J5N4_9PSED|nr:C39 family peptidase [Pseudomonas fuscovaginae]KPA87886.1 putative double-glycine peptidase [Pseudomonas fuscovaginae]KPA99014.1 putative double-glycine peptidase [Pseudomonas fuscovaginae]